jgi:fructokinase
VKIVCFGEALIDFLARPGATQSEPRAFLQFAGGAPANVAVAAARLGARSAFVGMLGTDMFGDFLQSSLADAGVDTSGIVRTDAARTALAFVQLAADGERSFTFYRPPSADLLFRDGHFRRPPSPARPSSTPAPTASPAPKSRKSPCRAWRARARLAPS